MPHAYIHAHRTQAGHITRPRLLCTEGVASLLRGSSENAWTCLKDCRAWILRTGGNIPFLIDIASAAITSSLWVLVFLVSPPSEGLSHCRKRANARIEGQDTGRAPAVDKAYRHTSYGEMNSVGWSELGRRLREWRARAAYLENGTSPLIVTRFENLSSSIEPVWHKHLLWIETRLSLATGLAAWLEDETRRQQERYSCKSLDTDRESSTKLLSSTLVTVACASTIIEASLPSTIKWSTTHSIHLAGRDSNLKLEIYHPASSFERSVLQVLTTLSRNTTTSTLAVSKNVFVEQQKVTFLWLNELITYIRAVECHPLRKHRLQQRWLCCVLWVILLDVILMFSGRDWGSQPFGFHGGHHRNFREDAGQHFTTSSCRRLSTSLSTATPLPSPKTFRSTTRKRVLGSRRPLTHTTNKVTSDIREKVECNGKRGQCPPHVITRPNQRSKLHLSPPAGTSGAYNYVLNHLFETTHTLRAGSSTSAVAPRSKSRLVKIQHNILLVCLHFNIATPSWSPIGKDAENPVVDKWVLLYFGNIDPFSPRRIHPGLLIPPGGFDKIADDMEVNQTVSPDPERDENGLTCLNGVMTAFCSAGGKTAHDTERRGGKTREQAGIGVE
ncbi:hypothetical protein OF83DRAFT_1087433 [Amylostereum chailletii]|nr:hypothetical protein OF83DRAFT_1087433 [Amylostereum chailletii]